MRRIAIATGVALASLSMGTLAHAQEEGDAATPTTVAVTGETTESQITVESEDVATDDDDDSDNTGLWGLTGLLGLLGLAGLAGRRRSDTAARGTTPPVGPAAPRTAEGATGGRDYND